MSALLLPKAPPPSAPATEAAIAVGVLLVRIGVLRMGRVA